MNKLITICLLLALMIFSQRAGAQATNAIPLAEAEQLSRRMLAILPSGWEAVTSTVSKAPNGWSGKTTALLVIFRSKNLKFQHDNSTPELILLWRTPIAYDGRRLPIEKDQDYSAEFLGTDGVNKWFLDAFFPIKSEIMKKFSITNENSQPAAKADDEKK